MLLIMDLSDVLLDLAKMFKYAGFKNAADGTFAGFVLSWFGFRLVIYPWVVLGTCGEGLWMFWV